MSEASRTTSRWSTSMSVTTKSTTYTNQTIPLSNVRRKLFRQSANGQKTFAQRRSKSKHDIEELFRLYYSNDIKFDNFQREIVIGTRVPTSRASASSKNHLPSNSTNVFNSKHCVSREQVENTDLNEKGNEPRRSTSTKRMVQIRTENSTTASSPISARPSPPTVTPVVSFQPIPSPTTEQEELCDSSLVKSVAFLGDLSDEMQENINACKSKPTNSPRSKSSLFTLPPAPPPPSFLTMSTNNRKDPAVQSYTSFSTLDPIQQQQQQQQQSPPVVVTGSAVIVRQRSPTRPFWSRQRTKSNLTTATVSSLPQSSTKTRSPSASNPSSNQFDPLDSPVFVGAQRMVSIPSKCSRYVLVTFPEVPVRYNAPSYVERLLLPERFPTLFQNIVQSYDHHFTSLPSHPHSK